MRDSRTAPKARKKSRPAAPRTPTRHRGIARYGALLDATERLLMNEGPDAIGLYQIAEQAGVPPASVYHFFPTKEAAYTALAERYCQALLKAHRAPIEARLLTSWQDLFRIDIRRGMEFYNSHLPALKIIYGGFGGVDARHIDHVLTLKLAKAQYGRLNRIFHMPVMRAPEKRFEIRTSLLDAIWAISIRQENRITEAYLEESYNACVAYTRLFLPEQLERRDLLISAAEHGASLSLPYD